MKKKDDLLKIAAGRSLDLDDSSILIKELKKHMKALAVATDMYKEAMEAVLPYGVEGVMLLFHQEIGKILAS